MAGIWAGASCGTSSVSGGKQASSVLVARAGAAVVAPAGEEDELELRHDRPGHAAHDVVEALVVEVVLDTAPTDVGDPAVDDEHLAMVEVEQVRDSTAIAADDRRHQSIDG